MIAATALAAVQLAVVALLVWERRQERRHASPNLDVLTGVIERLCQRIQAPNMAVLEHHQDLQPRTEEYAPPAVMPDDDDAFWSSRDKLAELLMDQETNGNR